MYNITFTWDEICERMKDLFGIESGATERYTIDEIIAYLEYIWEFELKIIHADELFDIERGN